jgi:myo-inositol-1(or 4)-monophosphatase
MAAGALLIQEAGGLVGDLEGESGFMASGDICAGTPKVFPAMLEALK